MAVAGDPTHAASGDPASSSRCVWVSGPIIVGAGPSGMALAACLRERGVPFLILERADCIASLWQRRTYDRLRLHLPRQFCELPLLPFPADFPEYPTKEQFIEYLHSYARRFNIEPRFSQTVLSARFDDAAGVWRVLTADGIEYIGRWLVAATGENAEQIVPEFDGAEDFAGGVVHVSDYKSGEVYRGKRVLVVGCGNSGMEVSLDLCDNGAFPAMVVRDSVHVLPREILGTSTFAIAVLLLNWLPMWLVDKILVILAGVVLGNLAKLGIRRPAKGPLELKITKGRTPVLDIGTIAKIRSGGIKIVPGIRRLRRGGAELVDGRFVTADAIVLATGYRSNIPNWLQGTDFVTDEGYPRTPFPDGWKGGSGLYTIGFTRRGISGAGADAVKAAEDIANAWHQETVRSLSTARI